MYADKALGVGSRLIGQLRVVCLGYGTLRACTADAYHHAKGGGARGLASPGPREQPGLGLSHSLQES